MFLMMNPKYCTKVLNSYNQIPVRSLNLKTIFLKIVVIFKSANILLMGKF